MSLLFLTGPPAGIRILPIFSYCEKVLPMVIYISEKKSSIGGKNVLLQNCRHNYAIISAIAWL